MNLSGNWPDFIIAFLGGVGLSFTPCVYPLIPITISYIGINAQGSHLRGLLYSFIYVSGIASMYAVLGLMAVQSGKMFGTISRHPVTQVIVGIVFILFGLTMMRVVQMKLPSVVKSNQIKIKGPLTIFFFGAVSGLVASPCVAPALWAILLYVATTHKVAYGASLLIVFGYGMGILLILAGTLGTKVLHLPKAGKWMVYVEYICAAVLIGFGLIFIVSAIRRIFV
ncbi:MAG: sulfite exporter TauE/SafE family protein [Candidatus Omnitrophica bacterium]|nr:sulfite exporter TauE/SafE family protein [Candidatus Omnitrophota bacterium]